MPRNLGWGFTPLAKALYSSLVEEQTTVRCLLDFKEIRVLSKYTR